MKLITGIVSVIVFLAGSISAEPADYASGRIDVIGEEGILGNLPLEHTSVEIVVSGNILRATVRQEYGNPYDEPIEAIYVFPLPDDGAVDRMNMHIGDRIIEGEIHERELAQQIYQEAIEAGQTASLLEQERPNIFTQSVGNIMPGDEIIIEISYVAPVHYDNGTYEISFPMVVGPRFIPGNPMEVFTGRGWGLPTPLVPDADRITPPVIPEGQRTGYDIEVAVRINAGIAVRELESVNHEIRSNILRNGTAFIELKNDDEIPNRDFVLRYTLSSDEIEAGVVAHNSDLGGYFLLMLQPDVDVDIDEITPKEMFFVIDCSGSMSGQPMEVAKETVRQFVQGMNPDDTFQIIRFSEDASGMSRSPLSNTEENVQTGIDYINSLYGSGGTMMIEGIRAAIGYPEDRERMRFVIFLTDGFIGNEAQIMGELDATMGENTRLFSIGVGSSPNRYLIEGLAESGRGFAYYVSLEEDPENAVAAIYEKINNPYLVGIQIDWGDLDVKNIYPSRIPDLYVGQPLVIVGQYDGWGHETIEITGTIAGGRWNQRITVDFPADQETNDVVATIWARRKIHELSRSMYSPSGYQEHNQGIVDEITDVALDYQIMCEYTAFVAVTEEVRNVDGEMITIEVPVEMPEGVSYEGVFGSVSEYDRLEYSQNRGLGGGAHYRSTSGVAAPGSSSPLMVTQECCDEEISGEWNGSYGYYGASPDVNLVSVNPTLGLLPSVVRSAVRAMLDEILIAYAEFADEYMQDEEEFPTGTIEFVLKVSSSGDLTEVRVVEDGVGSSSFAVKVTDVLENISLPSPPEGSGDITVVLSFNAIW